MSCKMGFDFLFMPYIAITMQKRFKGMAEEKIINNNTISTVFRVYQSMQAKGYKPASFETLSDDMSVGRFTKDTYKMANEMVLITNLSKLFILNFFHVLIVGVKLGKIPYKAWNPKGFTEQKELKKKINPNLINKSTDVVSSGIGSIKILAVAGVVVGAGILYFELSKRNK